MNKNKLIVAARVLTSMVVAMLAVWGGMALWFQLPALRLPAVVVWGAGALATLALWWWRRETRAWRCRGWPRRSR